VTATVRFFDPAIGEVRVVTVQPDANATASAQARVPVRPGGAYYDAARDEWIATAPIPGLRWYEEQQALRRPWEVRARANAPTAHIRMEPMHVEPRPPRPSMRHDPGCLPWDGSLEND
jgi:hypothetical protein